MSRVIFNVNTELQTLAAMCSVKPGVRGACVSVTETDFATETGQEVAKLVFRTIHKTGKPPAWNTLIESPKLSEESRETLESFDSIPKTADQASSVVDNLVTMRKIRVIDESARHVISRIRNDNDANFDIDSLISELQTSIGNAAASNALEAYVIASEDGADNKVNQLVDQILFSPEKDFFIPTGFTDFDSVNGGLPRGGSFLIGTPSGYGKSHTIGQLALNQARAGYRVLIVPLEMTVKEVLNRNIANLAKLDSLDLIKGRIDEETANNAKKRWNKFQKRVADAGGYLQYAEPTGSELNIREVLNYARSYDPDVLYLDYGGLLSDAAGDKQWQSLGDMLRVGKLWAGSSKRQPVFATAVQIDDESGKIRYSQMMKEHASLAWVAHANIDTKEDGVIPWEMLKGRNQKFIRWVNSIDYATSRVGDLAEDDPRREHYMNKKNKAGDSDKKRRRSNEETPEIKRNKTESKGRKPISLED